MRNRTTIDAFKQFLETHYSFNTIESAEFMETATDSDLTDLLVVPAEKMVAMQIVLFRIMISPFNLATQEVVFGLEYIDVLTEIDRLVKGEMPNYDGHYAVLFNAMRLTKLHFNLISNVVWDKLTTCADYYNERAMGERKNSINLLSKEEYKSGFYSLDILSLTFDDKIKLMQTLTPIQLGVLMQTRHLYYLRSHIGWVSQTLNSYYDATCEEATSIAVSMILQEPQPAHLESMGHVLHRYYRFIFSNASVDFNESVAKHFNSIPKVRYKNTFCYLLGNAKEKSLGNSAGIDMLQNFPMKNIKDSDRAYCTDGIEIALFLLLFFTAAGYCYYLYNKLNPAKNPCRRFGFIHNMSNKKNDTIVEEEKSLVPKARKYNV